MTSNLNVPDLYLSSSWDYRHEPLCLAAFSLKDLNWVRRWWLMPIFLATQEAEIRKISV
jgi:hypothetical protein